MHGAFADASGWNGVTERRQDRGNTVLAAANPRQGLSSDAAYIASVLDTINEPVVLVGHSYGGAILTNAARGRTDVAALVYAAAFAPAEGDTLGGLTAPNPGSELRPNTLVFRPHPGGSTDTSTLPTSATSSLRTSTAARRRSWPPASGPPT